LIPRPETEFLVEVALEFCRHQNLTRPRIIDIGTGSGCLAVTLAVKLPAAQVLALDLSPDALAIARQNAVTHCVADRIQFLESNYLSAVRDLPPSERVDVVVTNPPYISQAEFADLQREVRDFEPKMALVGGDVGTEGYAQILAELDRVLNPDGLFACEVGYTQAQAVAQLGQQAGWDDQRIIDDLQGIPRVVVLRKQPL
jgi:release factor glutamine methyltransferase